jgi:hypothetical protein
MTQDIPIKQTKEAKRYSCPEEPPIEWPSFTQMWLREQNDSNEALRKLIYDTLPDDTPFVSSILPK